MTPSVGTLKTERSDLIDEIVARSLREDVGEGDWTTLWTVGEEARSDAIVVSKEPLVLAGSDVAVRVFRALDPEMDIEGIRGDGEEVGPEEVVLRMSGRSRSILTAERTALNFLGRLSGIATHTRRFVRAIEGTGARVLDTRKTSPGLRLLEKDAVAVGGAVNHRMGLYDMVMIKDNHIAAAGGIVAAVRAVAASNTEELPVEVEVNALDDLDGLRGERVDRILLDNMNPTELRQAVERIHAGPAPYPEIEASGNVTLDSIRSVAETGVDFISVGALTHSAPVADLSLRLQAK